MKLKELEQERIELQSRLDFVERQIDQIIAPLLTTTTVTGDVEGNGIASLTVEGLSVKAFLPRNVQWDQGGLQEIAAKIKASGDDPSKYIKVSLGVPEAEFKKWPAPVQNVFVPARTVTPGKPKYVIVINEDAEDPDIPF